MDYSSLAYLRKVNPAWRLLRSDNAPLVLAFLHHIFIEPNARSLLQTAIIVKLDDFLYQLRLDHGENSYPKSSYAYLEDWANNDTGWLRKFYLDNSDEPAFDLTPATEKALAWLDSLQPKEFIGTESRLITLFDLLRQIAFGSETSAENKINELKQQRDKLDAQILALEKGEVSVMQDSEIKDRFMQFNQVSRELLGDFRQIEQNFRNLDQDIREKIATWEGTKGQLLQQIFGEQDAIIDTDQGQTFTAFWQFLMSAQAQQDLEVLLAKIFELEAIQSLKPDPKLKKIHYDWLAVGEETQKMVQKLSAQLHRFLDNQAYLKNKLLMQQLDGLLHKVVDIKEYVPDNLNLAKQFTPFLELELPRFEINLVMNRKLFKPPMPQQLPESLNEDKGLEVDVSSLFEEVFVDEEQLKLNIVKLLQAAPQINIEQILSKFPLKLGVAELVSYLSIATQQNIDNGWQALLDDENTVVVSWQDLTGKQHKSSIPNIIFTRGVNSGQ